MISTHMYPCPDQCHVNLYTFSTSGNISTTPFSYWVKHILSLLVNFLIDCVSKLRFSSPPHPRHNSYIFHRLAGSVMRILLGKQKLLISVEKTWFKTEISEDRNELQGLNCTCFVSTSSSGNPIWQKVTSACLRNGNYLSRSKGKLSVPVDCMYTYAWNMLKAGQEKLRKQAILTWLIEDVLKVLWWENYLFVCISHDCE